MAKQPTPRVTTKKHLARLERERIQQRNLMIVAGAVIVLIVGLILYGLLDQFVFQNLRPVARVENQSISTADFQKQVRFDRHRSIQQLISIASDPMMLQFFGSYAQQITTRLTSPVTIGQEVLDSMIEDILVAREAERRGITVSEEELNREVEQAFGFFENGTPTPTLTATPFTFNTATLSPTQLALVPPAETASPTELAAETATPEVSPTAEVTATPDAQMTATPEVSPTITLTPTITPTATPYTRELFEKEVGTFVENSENINFSRNDLRDYIRRQLLRRKVFEAITSEVPATGSNVWARHILVTTQEEAQQVLDRLQAGESFVDLARELSIDESNRDSGGDLGWFTSGRMVPAFEEAAFQLEVGETSQPVATEFGFHIIQSLGHEERPLTPEQVEQARQKIYNDWLEETKASADIETLDRWTSVVPSDPAIPNDVLQVLQQAQPQ